MTYRIVGIYQGYKLTYFCRKTVIKVFAEFCSIDACDIKFIGINVPSIWLKKHYTIEIYPL